MKSTGLVGLAVVVMGVTGIADHARKRSSASLPSVTPAAQVADATPAQSSSAEMIPVSVTVRRDRSTSSPDEAVGPAPVALPAPSAVVAQSQEARPRSRTRRSRSRNRYRGRIPTPSEWQPPEGPVRIALQVGHWRADEAPGELRGLRGGGTSWEDMHEWEANHLVARTAADMLEDLGYEVDLLPAVVPPGYRAHLFIAIHADGSDDPRASGFRVAAPRSDATGRAARVVDLLASTYARETGIRNLGTTTRRMRNYYAFNFRRYEHALHPMTIAVILETGFLTSSRDRDVILDAPERAARGIVEAVRAFPVTALTAEAQLGSEPTGR